MGKIHQKVRVSRLVPLIVLVALLAQATATDAQISANKPAKGLSPLAFDEAPCLDTNVPALAGPALLALADVAGAATATTGGLWVSGDTAKGFQYLRSIAGNQPADLLKIDNRGKVSFNLTVLAKAARITSGNAAEQRARIASFLRADEGLQLLAEVTSGTYRFLLHIGPLVPTRAGNRKNDGLRNLDNRFDSRVNPLRPNQQKLGNESPPEGVDSLIALNAAVYWFNLYNQQIMPPAQMIFHELAEAYARLVFGLDYLAQGDKPGAHDAAIDREIHLTQQRPGQSFILPIGLNLRLASANDWQWLDDKMRKQKGATALWAFE